MPAAPRLISALAIRSRLVAILFLSLLWTWMNYPKATKKDVEFGKETEL